MKNTRLIFIGLLSVLSLVFTIGSFVSSTYDLDVLRTKNDAGIRRVLSEMEKNKDPERLTEIAKRFVNYSATQRHERHERGVKQIKLMTSQSITTLIILILFVIELKKRKNYCKQHL